MSDPWRRVRGLLGVGVTWGISWAGIGAIVGLVAGVVSPDAGTLANAVFEWAVGMGLYGFVSGVGFGEVLATVERRKALADLSLPRVATWGVLGSAAVPLLFGLLGTFEPGTTTKDVLEAMLLTSFLGGTFAAASVAVARRAELSGPEEPELLTREPVPDAIRSRERERSAASSTERRA